MRAIPPALTLAWLLLGGIGQGAHAQSVSRQPYVQMTTEDSVAILWRTVGGTVPIVRYGPAPGVYDGEVLPVGMVIRLGPDVQGPAGAPRLHTAPPWTFQYEASIFGLQADTTYYYAVFDGDQLLAGGDADHRFTTHPPRGSETSLRLWITGDTGEGSDSQRAAFAAMRDYVAADGRPVDAYLHLGDMAYEVGSDSEFSEHFFDIYAELLRNTVVWPTMGNHEGITSSGVTQIGPYYDSYAVPIRAEAGGTASGTEAYYSFQIGRAHFICLNSHDLDRSPTGDMALWLKNDLEMAEADWLIAFWHHPPYTKGTHDSDREMELIEMRELIMPILESGGVDLVLCGHSHIYERSMLIDSAYDTPMSSVGVVFDDGDGDPDGDGAYRKSAGLNPNNGTVAMVAGHGEGGANIARLPGLNPLVRSVRGETGSVIVDIDGDVLESVMIDTDGVVRDRFRLVKRGEVIQEVVPFPWQATGPEFVVERFSPGTARVEIAAVPAVADARIHYRADGVEPDLDAPIYTGPVEIAGSGRVSAFSVWNAGERRGMTGESAGLDDSVSLHRYLAAGADDGVEAADGAVVLDGDALPIGSDGVVALRFADIRIPSGAYIHRARLQLFKAASSSVATRGEVRAELAPDSAALAGVPFEFSSRSKTVASVPWIVRTWSGSVQRDLNTLSPDLVPLVREVTGQAGWASGNAMTFFLEHEGGDRIAGSSDSGKANAATLTVTFVDPDGLGESVAAATPDLGRTPGGRYALSLRWPAEEIAAELGLSWTLEASSDLQRWSVVEPFGSSLEEVGDDGFGFLSVQIPFHQTTAIARKHFRIRIYQTP